MDEIEYKRTLLQFLLDTLSERPDLDAALTQLDFSIASWGGFGAMQIRENYSALVDHSLSGGWQDMLAFAAICARPSHPRAGEVREILLRPLQRQGVDLFSELNDNRIEEDWVAKAYHQVQLTQSKLWTQCRLTRRLTKLVATYEIVTNAESHGQDYIAPFVESIISAKTFPDRLATRLRRAAVTFDGMPRVEPLQLPLQPSAATDFEHVLISVEEPQTPSAKPFWNVSAYRCGANWTSRPIANAEAELGEAKFPQYLSQLRNTLDEEGIEIDQVVLHFFLPPKMLARPVDQWCFTLSDGYDSRIKCGHEFRVIVRLSKHFPARLKRLNSRWRLLRESTHCRETKEFLCLPRTSAAGVAYKTFLVLDQLQCVIVDAAISMEEDPENIPCLMEAFCAGIPVVIWGRDSATAQELVREAKQWLSNPLSQLPDVVRRYRLTAAADSASPGNHVTLLFEDADRNLPALTRLKASRV